MSTRTIIVFVLAVAACSLLSQSANAGLEAGAIVWRHDTALEATSATDFDGSNDTAEARARDWDTQASGLGLRADYRFPKLFAAYMQLGLVQPTVRSEDVSDPNQDVRSLGFDEGFAFGLGATVGGTFPNNERVFWSVDGAFSLFMSDLNQDINTSFDYDETSLMLGGTAGYMVRGVGVYGGLRLVNTGASLEETDVTNPAGQQTRKTEFDRDKPLDLLFGVRTGNGPVMGFVELSAVGSFGAAAGFAYRL
jgi:hypothetical protein